MCRRAWSSIIGRANTHTVLEVNGRDRPGLLHDVTNAISEQGLQIASAHVTTYGVRAVDVFYVKDIFGLKVENDRKLVLLREALLNALTPAERGWAAGSSGRAPAPGRPRVGAESGADRLIGACPARGYPARWDNTGVISCLTWFFMVSTARPTCAPSRCCWPRRSSLDFKQVPLNVLKGEPRSPEHLERHPFGKVPVVEWDGFNILETMAITRFLDAKLPGVSLIPSTLEDRARMDMTIGLGRLLRLRGVGRRCGRPIICFRILWAVRTMRRVRTASSRAVRCWITSWGCAGTRRSSPAISAWPT